MRGGGEQRHHQQHSDEQHDWRDDTRHQRPAVGADFPERPEHGEGDDGGVKPGAKHLLAEQQPARHDHGDAGERIIKRAADGGEPDAPACKHDPDQREEPADDHRGDASPPGAVADDRVAAVERRGHDYSPVRRINPETVCNGNGSFVRNSYRVVVSDVGRAALRAGFGRDGLGSGEAALIAAAGIKRAGQLDTLVSVDTNFLVPEVNLVGDRRGRVTTG